MRAALAFGVILLCSFAFAQSGKDLRTVRAVYLLPMGNGLDQYLAGCIARDGHYIVVTDPERADAIFTDRVGTGCENALKDLYHPPAQDSDENKFGAPAERSRVASPRARGTVFLVDRASRTVLWSTYVPVSGTRPEDVEKRARRVADALAKQLKRLAKESSASVIEQPAEPRP